MLGRVSMWLLGYGHSNVSLIGCTGVFMSGKIGDSVSGECMCLLGVLYVYWWCPSMSGGENVEFIVVVVGGGVVALFVGGVIVIAFVVVGVSVVADASVVVLVVGELPGVGAAIGIQLGGW